MRTRKMSSSAVFRLMASIWILLLPSYCEGQGVTIEEVLASSEHAEDISLFRHACQKMNIMDSELGDTSRTITLFVPTNEAIESNVYFSMYINHIMDSDHPNPPLWHEHIMRTVRNHMIDNLALTSSEVFDNTRSHLYSMEDPIEVQQPHMTLGNSKRAKIIFGKGNIQATNGMVHIIDHVLEPEFYTHSFAELERQEELGPDWLERQSMVTIADFTDSTRDSFRKILPQGQTHVGCRIRALNRIGLFYLPKTINLSENPNIKWGEFLNASFREETIHNLIEYSLPDKNVYRRDLPKGHVEWIMSPNNCSHMLITVDKTGTLCFNDGCVVSTPKPREWLSNNGVGYIVDKCTVCAGVAMLLEYAAWFTDEPNLNDASQFWETSEWNLRNLSLSSGNGTKITLLAARDEAFNIFNSEDLTRIATDKWKRHQWNFLEHNMLQGEYYRSDFIRIWEENLGKPYNITAISGENVTFDYDADRDMVLIQGGDVLKHDLIGVDGVLHFLQELPVPKSVTHSVYDMAAEWANYTTQVTLIDTVFLKHDLRRLIPITGLFAPNEAWANKVIELEDISKSVLENMVFKELQWCERLREMKGERLESHNGQTWKITVNETTNMPCFDMEITFGGPVRRSCVTECDILVRNGIVHKVDQVLFFEVPETVGPQPPTIPTHRQPNAPNFYQPPTSPTISWEIPRPTFFGAINPAYAAKGEEGHGKQSSAPSLHNTFSTIISSLSIAAATIVAVMVL